MRSEVVIVGAGFAGATAARLLADAGKRVLVVEKHKQVGGHCHDYKNAAGITVHTYGPHLFHTADKRVWDFVTAYSDFFYYQHRVLSYAQGKLFPFPINTDTINEVFGCSISVNEVEDFLKAEVKRSQYANPPIHFRDAVVSQVGQRLYELFFKNYTIKQWGKQPEQLSADLAKRIPVRSNRDDRYFSDPYQGVPVSGFTALIQSILDHPNISILLGMDFFDIQKELSFDHLVYTGELDRYFDHCHGKLEYRSLNLVFKTLDQEYYQKAAVVNYPNDYDWTRITEFKQITGEKAQKTTILYEYPQETGEPYYVVPTEENQTKREAYMREVLKLEQSRKVMFIGRLAEYKYYNMDQVIAAAMEKIKALC